MIRRKVIWSAPEIARRAADEGYSVAPDSIVTTAGCQNALYLCLQVLTQRGISSPSNRPVITKPPRCLRALGLRAIEIPSRSDTGMSLEALRLALSQWPVKAILTVANFSNPMGSLIPEDAKRTGCHCQSF